MCALIARVLVSLERSLQEVSLCPLATLELVTPCFLPLNFTWTLTPSPRHNVQHLMSPTPCTVTTATGQMEGGLCNIFYNCQMLWSQEINTMLIFIMISFPSFLFARRECRASSLSPQPATRMWWMPSTELLPLREFGGQWEGWTQRRSGQDPPMPSILPAMRNSKGLSVMSFTQGLTVIWLMVPQNMHLHR